ncbi:hypothetical protein [Hyalangium versicolor]|uniref:hypothetical protein n=1 Tax=Hyalangium versicolor TaxID=2861190 RepID=UPI001CCE0065|nr:hypothetical protein [Hyalangium versicolor]
MPESREWTFGTHRAWWEPPDILWVKYSGPSTVEHTRNLVDIVRELGQRIFIAVDVAGSSMAAENRNYFTEQARPEWFRAVIYLGAGPTQRAMAKGLMVRLLFTGKWNVHFEFAETEAEARDVIARLREQQSTGAA